MAGNRVIIDPTANEYQQILDAGKFSGFLKDHWPSAGQTDAAKPVAGHTNEIRTGDQVEVQWKESWYPATVLRIEKRGYFIHYQGYDNSWDEYVWENRIRSVAK